MTASWPIAAMIGRRASSAATAVHSPAMSTDDQPIEFEEFPERPLAEAERALERLLASGEVVGEAAAAEHLRAARVPASAGPAFLSLARRFRSVRLSFADVRIDLHAGGPVDDALGGWRLATDPPEIDLRLAAPTGATQADDTVYDATWSPHGSGAVVRHSTIVHFLVRAAAGDGA
jgi:hypothetical protein